MLAFIANSTETEDLLAQEIWVMIIDMVAAIFGAITVWIIMPMEDVRKWNYGGTFLLMLAGTLFVIAEFLIFDKYHKSHFIVAAAHLVVLGNEVLMITSYAIAPWHMMVGTIFLVIGEILGSIGSYYNTFKKPE